MSFNNGRGVGHLIPYDNLVERNVHMLKDKCRKIDVYVTFEGSRKLVKFLSIFMIYQKQLLWLKQSSIGIKHTKNKSEKNK